MNCALNKDSSHDFLSALKVLKSQGDIRNNAKAQFHNARNDMSALTKETLITRVRPLAFANTITSQHQFYHLGPYKVLAFANAITRQDFLLYLGRTPPGT